MNKVVYNSGFKPSVLDGTERVYGASATPKETKLPAAYSYRKYLPEVYNQGQLSICVPCSVSAFLNWRENLKTGSKKDNKIDYFQIYDSRTNDGDGMSFKDALFFLRHNGVKSNLGVLKIEEYALIRDVEVIKKAIVMNGPCVAALPVYNSTKEFWNERRYDRFLGYHAISIVGYNQDGLIIRNSWGKTFGDGGYTLLKYKDAHKIVEMWTIIE